MANEEQLAILRQGIEDWNKWREENPNALIDLSDAKLSGAILSGADLGGAILSGADLTCANLSNANLNYAILSEAILIRAKLFEAKLTRSNLIGAILFVADLSNAILSEAKLTRSNLIGAILRGADLSAVNLSSAVLNSAILSHAFLFVADLSNAILSDANLSGADLTYANLSDANLQASQVLDANLGRATLTGACIQDWQIGSGTGLEDVKCDYIFRAYDPKKGEFTGRLPVDPSSTLAPGEFEQWMQVRKGALDTIDITFKDGIDWQAFFQSLQVVRQQHPDANVVMKSVEEESGIFVARIKVETEESGEALEKLKADIETQIKSTYELQLAEARGANIALERSLDNALGKLAMTSKYTIHGDVGNLADTNFGAMTAHINRNSEAINQLIESLRTSAQSFPSKQKEEALMDLDELEEAVDKPEKRDPKRIGIRLKRLIAAGTAVATIAGGAATFTGNVNEFTENVLQLGEKIGLTREDVLGNQDNPK